MDIPQVQAQGLCVWGGEISWIPKVDWESYPKLEVSVAVSKVKSRQVSEVKKNKFSKSTSLLGGGTLKGHD